MTTIIYHNKSQSATGWSFTHYTTCINSVRRVFSGVFSDLIVRSLYSHSTFLQRIVMTNSCEVIVYWKFASDFKAFTAAYRCLFESTESLALECTAIDLSFQTLVEDFRESRRRTDNDTEIWIRLVNSLSLPLYCSLHDDYDTEPSQVSFPT